MPMEFSIDETMRLLAEFSWVSDFQVTRFFVDRVWQQVPEEWKETLSAVSLADLEGIPFGKYQECWPESLKQFIRRCLKSSLNRDQLATAVCLPLNQSNVSIDITRGMSAKKLHEVCHMTSFVDHVTSQTGSDAIVDVGSGLGYLGQVLHKNFGRPVLGLESRQCHTSGADKRAAGNQSCPGLKNITCELQPDDETIQHFKSSVQQWFSELTRDGSTCSHVTNSAKPTGSPTVSSPTVLDAGTSGQVGSQTCCNCLVADTAAGHQTDSNRDIDCRSTIAGNTACHTECQTDGSCDSEPHNGTAGTECRCHGDGGSQLSCHGDVKDDTGCHGHWLEPKICMVGLHCCGDLTPTMLKYFAELNCVRGLCCVSCCYHRMRMDEESKMFDNFPLSLEGRKAVTMATTKYPDWLPTVFSLRLAAQETRSRWKGQTATDHDCHMRNVAYRALLEACLQHGFQLEKSSRKLAHKADYDSIDRYIAAVSKHITMPDNVNREERLERFRSKMLALHHQYRPYFCYIEPITALQVLLQPVLETLIYRDRQAWLQEAGYQSSIIPVFDEGLSPRNLALVAVKP